MSVIELVLVRRLCDAFDFDEGAGGEVRDLDAGAGRLRGEVLTVDSVERREVVDVVQEAGGLQHVVEVGAGGFQDFAEVLADLMGLALDGGVDDLALGGVDRDLPGGEDQLAGGLGLGVRAEGGRCGIGMDGSHSGAFFLRTAGT